MPTTDYKPTAIRLHLVTALLVLLAMVLFCMQYTTVFKLAALPPSFSYVTVAKFLAALSQYQIELDTLDVIWLGLLISTIGTLLLLEYKSGYLTIYLEKVLSTQYRAILFFFCCSFVLVRYYFAPGHPSWASDAPQHITYAEITRQILSQGELPIWTNALGAGSPYLQFYGFLFFYLSAAVAIVVDDFFSGLKITLALCHIVSGLGLYALISYKTHSRKAGFFAGLVYVLCFWHTQQILILGRLPLSLFYALLPWPFYFLERALRTAYIRNILSAALTLGLLALTHPGYGFWATIFFSIYATLHVCTGRIPIKRGMLITGSTLVLGLLVGAYLTLPMWLEKGNTGLSEGFRIDGPIPSWWHLFVWSNYRFWLLPPSEAFHWYGGYLGISAVVTAFIGIVCSLRWKRRETIAIWLPFFLCALIIWGHKLFPLSEISVIQAFPPVRYLLFIVFFLSASAGLGFHYISIWSHKVRRPQTPTIVLLFLLFDLGPTTFQHVYTDKNTVPSRHHNLIDVITDSRDSMDEILNDGSLLRKRESRLPNYRFLWSGGDQHPYLVTNWPLFISGVPTPCTVHPGDLLSGRKFTNLFERLVNDIYIRKDDGNALSYPEIAFAHGGLRMLNVGLFMSITRDKNLFTGKLLPDPILTSSRLTPYQDVSSNNSVSSNSELYREFRQVLNRLSDSEMADYRSVIEIIENTEVDKQGKRCTQILVRNLEQPIQLPMRADITLLQHEVSHSRVDLHFTASDSTFIRLAYSYYPHLSVRLNGKEIEPYETAGHFIALPVSEGTHHIELVAQLSPLRRWLLGIHLGLCALTAVAWIRRV